MLLQWKRFQFFDKEKLCDEEAKGGGGRMPMQLFKSFEPTCSTSGRGHLVFGDANGVVRVVTRDFEVQKFQAHESGVLLMKQMKRENLLVTIGTDGVDDTTIKMWRLDGLDGLEEGESPKCARSLQVFSPKFPKVAVTCFDVLEDLTQLAIGLGNGAVLLHEGHLLRDRRISTTLLQQEGQCVTGVFFCMPNDPGAQVSLFVTTTKEVVSFFTKTRRHTRVVLDHEVGCDLNAACLNNKAQLVVGRDKAVYFYDQEEKNICFGFEGVKHQVSWFNDSLCLVTAGAAPNQEMFTVYDLKNKLVAFSARFPHILVLLPEWGSLFLLTKQVPEGLIPDAIGAVPMADLPTAVDASSQEMWQLAEKGLPAKMNMLFRKNLYDIAINLANSQDCDEAYIKDIFLMYGDHLRDKRNYDGAMEQYVKTIGHVEPSYVIRKFLDAQRIHNLTRYLEALHECGCANAEHTTLLLNCYTKLKDVRKLDQFVKTDSGYSFDVETALRVCRQAGYHDHALFLAQKEKRHDWYFKIQLHDMEKKKDEVQTEEQKASGVLYGAAAALQFLWTLDFEEAAKYAKEHGKAIMSILPDETTAFLQTLCTNFVPRRAEEEQHTRSDSAGSPVPDHAEPDEFIALFIGKDRHLESFLEFVVDKRVDCGPLVYNTLIELYMQASQENGSSREETQGSVAQRNADKIMNLLKNPRARYDVDHALVMAKLFDFERAIVYLFQKQGLYDQILQYHMDRDRQQQQGQRKVLEDEKEEETEMKSEKVPSNRTQKIIQTCKKFGERHPNLWIQALQYFVRKDSPDHCISAIHAILKHIQSRNLVPPLQVVQMVAENKTKPLSVIQDYLMHVLHNENALIEADEEEMKRYRAETEDLREKLAKLKSEATTFQGTRCDACTAALELPSIHFLCNHSFHARCLTENDRECPRCAPEFLKVQDIHTQFRKSAGQHDKFFKQLEDAPDGFATVAEYFGRGIFLEAEPDESVEPTPAARFDPTTLL